MTLLGTRTLQIGMMLTLWMALMTAGPARAADLDEIFAPHDPDSTIVIDNSAFAAVLETYLSAPPDGVTRFAYGDVTEADHQTLKGYIQSLEAVDVATLNRDEQYAYWANLYNAVTLDVVLDAYPVDSIRQIKDGFFSAGPWGRAVVTVKGVALSLDNIEHDIMREVWDDPRVHYAVNCASIGCPNLYAEPFTGATLDATLDRNARAYINHPRGARVVNGRLRASSIYRWYKSDFGRGDLGVINHMRQYAEPDLIKDLKGITEIYTTSYDWSLNAPDTDD